MCRKCVGSGHSGERSKDSSSRHAPVGNNYVTNWRNRLNSTQYNRKTLQTFYGQTTCYDAAAFSDPTWPGVLG